MNTIFIDTHLWDIRIVLFKDGIVVDKCEVTNKKNNSEYIFPSLIKVIDGKKIDNIIVVIGPGSFTGVRLGVTIAKTLSYTLNIPIKTVSSLECIAVSNNAKEVAFSDGNGYYVGRFAADNSLLDEYKYYNLEDFAKLNVDNKVVTNNELDYEKIYDFVQNNKKDEVSHAVKPIYVKKIGVEK